MRCEWGKGEGKMAAECVFSIGSQGQSQLKGLLHKCKANGGHATATCSHPVLQNYPVPLDRHRLNLSRKGKSPSCSSRIQVTFDLCRHSNGFTVLGFDKHNWLKTLDLVASDSKDVQYFCCGKCNQFLKEVSIKKVYNILYSRNFVRPKSQLY